MDTNQATADYRLYRGVWVNDNPMKERPVSKEEANLILSERGGYAVRNVYDFDCASPTEFWFVVKDSFGGMEELSSKMRNQVRRSFKECDFRMIGLAEMMQSGYEVYVSACEGYRKKAKALSKSDYKAGLDREAWKYEFWGAFEKASGKMIAYAQNMIVGDICNYSTLKADPSYQKRCYPYYGLLYEMNRYYLEEKQCLYVSDGAKSMTNHSNIQPFLIEKFKFRKAYCHMNMYYRQWFGLLIKMVYPFRRMFPGGKIRVLLEMEYASRNS